MSHKEYCKELSEDQLRSLIDIANAKLKGIESEGFVSIWCITDGWVVRGRFSQDDYKLAVQRMIQVVKSEALKNQPIEIRLEPEKVRPSELEALLSENYHD